MVPYNAEELFQMAEAVERDGMRFYRRAAETVDDPELTVLFNQLADWEAKHGERFAAMRAELPPSARHESVPGDPLAEHAGDYLQAFVDGRIFPDVARDGVGEIAVSGLEELFTYALGREKDTIVFFLTLQSQVPKYWGRERIQAIVEEELKHVHILEAKKRALRVARSSGGMSPLLDGGESRP